MSLIQFLLSIQIKRSKVVRKSGFTLIELLVAVILAVLVITPLLGFMVNILNTDRQEQDKASSEQEIQTALDYIARDLQQAVYIYDAPGIDAIKSQLPSPNDNYRVPVLVFWKREFIEQVLTVRNTTTNTDQQDDTFVYSLVAYYLIKDTNSTWSNAARIARWQIKDGVPVSSGGVTCDGYSGKYVSSTYCPSSGFALFKLDGSGTIEQKMNKWTGLTSYSYPPPVVLVDFIDQTTTTNGAPAATCPPNSTTPPITWSKVPPASFNTQERDTARMTSFYACIDRVNTTAQVFLRGNALARLQNNNPNYNDSTKTYFPTASIRVKGRGFLFTK